MQTIGTSGLVHTTVYTYYEHVCVKIGYAMQRAAVPPVVSVLSPAHASCISMYRRLDSLLVLPEPLSFHSAWFLWQTLIEVSFFPLMFHAITPEHISFRGIAIIFF